MRVTSSFRDFILDQLAPLERLDARAMFGGVGLYASDVFFGILAADVLYLKVDDTNRGEYEAARTSAFKPYADRPMSMSYYEVPLAVVEDSTNLVTWARRAIGVAQAALATKGRVSRRRSDTRQQSRPPATRDPRRRRQS